MVQNKTQVEAFQSCQYDANYATANKKCVSNEKSFETKTYINQSCSDIGGDNSFRLSECDDSLGLACKLNSNGAYFCS